MEHMSPIDVSEWRKREKVVTASTRGFNPLVEIPKLLKETYPDLRELAFGFFTLEDRPARYVDGWRHLKPEHFPDYESFNQAVGSRFGMIPDAEGNFKLKENFVMFMPNFYRDRYKAEVQEQSEREYQQKTKGAPAIDGSQGSDVDFNETKKRIEYQPLGPEPQKRGPGRPPKEK